MGVNGVTGDYRPRRRGFWIEDGAIAYPVSEITIASNLKTMFRELEPADDLELRRHQCPIPARAGDDPCRT